MNRNTNIICTLGPASTESSVLYEMALCGMDVARLNFSHGSYKAHQERIRYIRQIARKTDLPLKILQDLQGYRIRIGKLKKPRILKPNQKLFLMYGGQEDKSHIPFDYADDLSQIKKGLMVYIDDGLLALKVIGQEKHKLKVQVMVGGLLKERKGINIPGMTLGPDILTEKDKADIEFGIKHSFDYVAQSFVRNLKDIQRVADLVKSRLPKCQVIAKIENEEGVRNLDRILDVADGVMVARGDLGVSLPIYQIAILQKDIIRRCNRRKKFAVTATQMLESMTTSPRPTRAEVTDITNAILDGTDFVMLSGETAVGVNPVECIRMMRQIIDFTEAAEQTGLTGSSLRKKK